MNRELSLLEMAALTPTEAFDYDQLYNCMRCGLCLPHCPTFALTGQEIASPRGRLALIRAVSEGQLEITPGFNRALTMCLGCLACQTACPAGVPYGEILEQAREQLEIHQQAQRTPLMQRAIDWLVGSLLYGPHGLEPFMPLLRLYHKLGLQRLNLARMLPGPLGNWELLLPPLKPRSAHKELGEFVPAKPPVRGRAGLLTGCLENTLLTSMITATARVLSHEGFEVIIPRNQVCCGALPGHIGRMEQARQQARDNIDAFESADVEVVISDAAGCSAQLKEYDRLLAGDPDYMTRAAQFAAKARDITEFLADLLPLRSELRELDYKVTYDDPCHLIHGQGISTAPRELIQMIPGVDYVELPESSWCCGSAGTYNLTHDAESTALLERKLMSVQALAPDILLTANTGCYIQLAAGIKRAKLNVEVLHIIELLDRAIRP